MKGILLAGHGSRQKSTERIMEALAAMTMENLAKTHAGLPVEIAYMEFGQQSIPGGLAALAEKGVTDIAVVPCFLFDGIHLREDIPALLEAYGQKNPHVKLTLAGPLGADARIAEILADRVRESLT